MPNNNSIRDALNSLKEVITRLFELKKFEKEL